MFLLLVIACSLAMTPPVPPVPPVPPAAPVTRPLARYAKLRVVVRGDVEGDEIARREEEMKQAARVLLNVEDGDASPIDVETSIFEDGEASISMSMMFSMIVGSNP